MLRFRIKAVLRLQLVFSSVIRRDTLLIMLGVIDICSVSVILFILSKHSKTC